MTHVGIDLEQFIADPYTSGIQRVLQYLAREWPSEEVSCDFVIPFRDEFVLATPQQASTLLNEAFDTNSPDELRSVVNRGVERLADECPRVRLGSLLPLYSSWLLPEVSYLPSVLERFGIFQKSMPVSMIGYDALPMTEPGNYRFVPGTGARVSEYFRLLASADSVVCISEYSRESILWRLRRDPTARITVAHPGGDHVPAEFTESKARETSGSNVIRFLRVGTVEARKMPKEILSAFQAARQHHPNIELRFVGNPSASDSSINNAIESAIADRTGVSWVQGASDAEVWTEMRNADVFLSIGTEGFGIPVLESIRVGTPVVAGGIQPAAQIMGGRGARIVEADDAESIAALFEEFASPSAVASLGSEVQPSLVPQWRDFVNHVAHASVG